MVGSIKRKLKEYQYENLECPSREELDLSNNELVSKWFKEKNHP